MTANAPIRVLHVIKGLGRGGAERLLEHAQRQVDRERFRLHFAYFLEHKGALAETLRDLGGDVSLLRASGPGGMALAAGRLTRLVRERRIDLIHAHLPLSATVARLAGHRARVPVVYTEHNLHERHHPMSRWANRATWKMQRQVIAVSSAVAQSIDRHLGDRVPVRVVPNGVPVGELGADPAAAQSFRARLDIASDAPVVGQIAVFRPEKRLGLWLETAALVRQSLPECRFVLVGDGPERERLERRAHELGLDGAVHFTGLLDDVRPALWAFDVMLVSSKFEGLPLVVLEAMAASVPVVATAVGGIPEAIENGNSGILIEQPDAEALSRATIELLGTPALSDRLGRAALARVTERYSSEAMQRRLEALYLEVLAR